MRTPAPGTLVVALLVAGVVAVAWPAAAPASARASLAGAGRLAGVLALVTLLTAAALSVRIPRADRWFGGLTRLWQTHHALGALAFLAAMLHPWLLAFAATGTTPGAVRALLLPPAQAWPAWAGWIALLALTSFLAPTFAFFGTPEYQRWKRLHALAGVAVAAALAHALPLAGAVPRSAWVALGALAIAAYLYRRVLAPLVGRARYVVAAVVPRAPDVAEILLAPTDRVLAHAAGQFVYLTPRDPALAAGRGEEHPYTVASAPGEPELRIAVKGSGDASRALLRVAPGTDVGVEGPYGDFFAGTGTRPELWIAGGIGIAPFLARVRELAALGARTDAVLVYCAGSEAQAPFLAELRELAARIAGLRLVPHLLDRDGVFAAAFLRTHCADAPARTVRLCGPAGLARAARAALRAVGAGRAPLHTEEFTLL